jgi:biotin carboxylase
VLTTPGPRSYARQVEGAGSEGVSICNSPDEVRQAYATLEGTRNCLGLLNYSVLLQEYLKGDEYVVDTVSRSGVHKCVAIWKYDKRLFNGSPVVYFGMRLMPVEAEAALPGMIEYVFKVLDVLGIRNGAVHSEVKLEERGPGTHPCSHPSAHIPLLHPSAHIPLLTPLCSTPFC